MKKFIFVAKTLILSVCFSSSLNAQLTYVPDDGFEQMLINYGYDSGPLDDYVPTAAIDTIQSLTIAENNSFFIESIVGIEDFTSLKYLQLGIIISGDIHITANPVDLSQNTNLDSLVLFTGYGQTITNTFTFPPNITYLVIAQTNYENIDLTGCPLLEGLGIYSTINSNNIDLSNCPNLKVIALDGTGLDYIDLSFCPLLDSIDLANGISQICDISYFNLRNGNNSNLVINNISSILNNNITFCVDDVSSSFSQYYYNIFQQWNGSGSLTLTDVCATNKITGTVLYDINNDGCATSTAYIPNYLVNSTDGTNSFYTSQNNNQFYNVYTYSGTYQTTVTNLPSYLTANPYVGNSVFVGDNNIDTINFCVTPNQSINDVSVSYVSGNIIPGFNAFGNIVFQNNGTTTMSGTVSLSYDNSKLNFLTASENVVNQTANQITFNYSNLSPFETRSIQITYDVFTPPTTVLGDSLIFLGNITPLTGDYTPSDNDFKVSEIVIGSFDPNDIKVVEGEAVSITKKDEYLHYLIRFQNTGTFPASFVNVHSDLDSKLDWNTLQILEYSHPVNLNINNGRAEFSFDNINLADSTSNEPASHGYVYYKIKPKNTVVLGDSIFATASIYFDYNTPVITNTAFTVFVEDPLTTEENQMSYVSIYPIPTSEILYIKSDVKLNTIVIFNQLGNVVMNKYNSNQIDVSILPTGIYYCQITDIKGAIITQKIIIE